MADRTELLGRAVADADRVTVLTGAGVSTASGVPDFRGEEGLWERYDRDQFGIERFEADPAGFWADWRDVRAELFPAALEPNACHDHLAALVEAGAVDTLVTQNTDGLHAAAGTPEEELVRLHGRTDRVVCPSRTCRFRGEATLAERADDLPPTCPECGGPLKPGVVLFGESLPEYAHLSAHAAAEKSELFLVVGSSLTVEPAASLPETALGQGATLAVLNREPTPLDGRAAYAIHCDAGPVLGTVREVVLGDEPTGAGGTEPDADAGTDD